MADINDLISQAYAGIGRSDTGEGLAAITQGEKDYWAGQIASGALNEGNFQNAFNNAVNEYRTANPNDPYTQYVNNYQAQQAAQASSAPATQAPLSAPTPAPDYTDLVTQAYGGIGRTGVGTNVSNIDQGGLDYWKGQLASGALTPQNFQTAFNSAVNEYRTANPNDAYTQYVNNYQLDQQADPMKTYLNNAYSDNTISWQEANDIKAYQDNYGFKPEDIARVTGLSLDKVNQALGARGNIIGQNITANLNNPVGLVDYAQENKLSAKDLASASGGVLSEAAAQALLDKGSTYAGKVELASPEAAAQIRSIISRAVGHDYGGKEADWMYKMFGGLEKSETSQAPQQLELNPEQKVTRVIGGDEGGTQTEEVTIPGTVKQIPGLRVVETDEEGRPTKYVKDINSKDFNLKPGEQSHTGTQGLVAEYDASGKLLGYSSGNRIYTSDPDWVGARWNADGTPAAYGGHTAGGGFVKGLGNDVAAMTADLGPLWTVAKIVYPELNLVDVGADVARSEVGLNTAVKGALGYAGMQDASAADLTNPSSVNATSGLDIGNGVSPAVQMTQNAQYAKLGAAGITAAQAADKGNYAPLLGLAANVAGINKMPEVATSMNVLSAANAIATNNPSALLSAAGNLTGSPDLKLAGAATRLVNAINSGDQAAIAVAGMAFSSAVNANAPNAASAVKTTLFGPTKIDTSGLQQGSPINPSGPSTSTSDAGPLGGINLAGADNRYEMGGPPIFAGTAKAANVTEPVGYRLMTMDEADARPEGSYYDITQNAWFTPDKEGMNDVANLQGALTGQVPAGYGTDVTNLDRTGGQNGVSGTAPYTSSTGPLSDGVGEIVVTGDRPTADIPEIVVTADRPVVNDAGEIVVTADRPVTEPPVVTPPPSVTPPVVSTPSSPIQTTARKLTSAPLTAAAQSIPTLDSSPQGLTSKMQKDKKILKDLTMLFGTLTPELVSALEDRGIRVPEPEKVKAEEEQKEPDIEKQLAEERALETKFAATGGEIVSKIDPKINYTPAGMLPAAQVLEQQSRLGALRHLREGIANRPTGGLAHGGLPKKYADATPEGHKPEFITGLTGYYASGAGTGQSDDIDAILHDGDYVADADLVAALGDGSSKAGAEALEKFRRQVPHQEHAEGGSAVPAKIADGEYVFPASFVTALGRGDNKAGARLLDKMREAIREHKRSAPVNKIPPKAKSPLDYLKMVKG